MKVEEKRIFISDLPETATQTDIENVFSNYGNVISVEIKERKELGPKNKSLFFAYINIQIDDKHLQQCFKDFSNEKWLGHYVLLQIARESFLDRLKRERESAGNTNNVSKLEKVPEVPQQVSRKNISNGIKKDVKRKYKSSSESDSSDTDSSKSEDIIEPIKTQNITTKEKKFKSSSTEIKDVTSRDKHETVDFIIKNNKGKVIDKNGLKIEVGNKPIIVIDKSKKAPVNTSEANLKRLQALNDMKKRYQNQKALIQAGLSNIDRKSKSKIIFDDNIENTSSKISNKVDKQSRSKNLFDDDSNEDEEFEANFSIKEQYQGEEGQKLLELQSKYKNDKRFILDERFLDKRETSGAKNKNDEEQDEEISLEEEKKKEFEILGQVLGKNITPKFLHQKESHSQQKFMLRFDPTQPEHSKFEIKREQGSEKKRKKKDPEVEILDEKKQDEKEIPSVSKEIFYKVTDNLKENLHVEQGFSLLSMFGQQDERGEQVSEESSKQLSNKSSALIGQNPFRYDSSDDEDETGNIPNKDQEVEKSTEQVHTNTSKSSFWSEPFFFISDDYKFQDGFDFIEKMKAEDKNEFTKLRRDLKDIVKTKVRNNQRKHKPFKKKLGGNKKKKMIKMKKALKR